MFNSYIVRYSEISLKGQNRSFFEKRLIKNIKDYLKKNNKLATIQRFRGRIIIKTKNKLNLSTIPGIHSYSRSIETNLNLKNIQETALKLYKKGSFRISTKRLTKDFLSSTKLNKVIGEFIINKTKAKVNLTKPSTNIGIDILNDKAYLYNEKIKAIGGLPVSSQGKVILLLENKDSIKAGILALKRGCSLSILKVKNIPYKELEKYSYGSKLKEIKEITNEKAIIVSDTLSTIKKRNYNLLILRPLIGYENLP